MHGTVTFQKTAVLMPRRLAARIESYPKAGPRHAKARRLTPDRIEVTSN
jgi:hypothetical protein